jgi:hypothetical protein
MDVRHDYVDPDNCSDPAPLRMEPVRGRSMKWLLLAFAYALGLSALMNLMPKANAWISWVCGILVGTTGFNLLLEWIER